MAFELTTSTGITCPKCGKDFEFKTDGLFGGLIAQLIMQGALSAIKRKGVAKCTCNNCKHEFEINKKEK